ncbi:hypothetical protein V2W30_14025 [Streptomyces sp. Q6]|uniref:Uncharacterized protein n=1 Tax=Streptomyces citrinus TaxID=3118173 RepID=A0ACD5AB42_9ACTN
MAGKKDRWNNPHWHLLMVLPILIWLITERDAGMRFFEATGLTMWAVAYGRALAGRARARSAPDRDIRS